MVAHILSEPQVEISQGTSIGLELLHGVSRPCPEKRSKPFQKAGMVGARVRRGEKDDASHSTADALPSFIPMALSHA